MTAKEVKLECIDWILGGEVQVCAAVCCVRVRVMGSGCENPGAGRCDKVLSPGSASLFSFQSILEGDIVSPQ